MRNSGANAVKSMMKSADGAGLMFARVVARDLHGRDRAAGIIGLITMITT